MTPRALWMFSRTALSRAVLASTVLWASACGLDQLPAAATEGATTTGSTGDAGSDTSGDALDVHALAGGCYAVGDGDGRWLTATANGEGFAFVATAQTDATRFLMQPADLATYLLYDQGRGYLVSEDGPLLRTSSLTSDALSLDDSYISGGEWTLQESPTSPAHYALAHRKTGSWLATDGLTNDPAAAVPLAFVETTDCAAHPELTLDATGEVTARSFDDGSVYGIVDTHSHILSNFAFGGGGIFHGAPFHRLGVQHALPDCETFHGTNGRKDFFGFAFDTAGADGVDLTSILPSLLNGELDQDNHRTAGYPAFTDWPNGPTRSTHQTQYYRWLERAYLAGLRLVVQHATTNSVICDFMAGQGIQPLRYACDDMIAVDRIIEETYALERYIDAQSGGPGLGWFRVVQTPAQARAVIQDGKLAVVLGIETSDLFNCFLVPRDGDPVCDADYVVAQLDRYHALGVRALFPVHKYDNAFSAGDGDRAFIELGNFLHTGHWSNFTEDCPVGIPAVFDQGDVAFGGLNMPRDDYDAPPPNDFSNFPNAPLATALPHFGKLEAPALPGDYCQNAGLSAVGETLITQMMARGMIIEIDHLPRRSYQRAFELLEANDYPAVGSHGTNFDGRLYKLGGVSKTGLGRCREPGTPGTTLQRLADRIALIEANGGYPAEGFGFDLNGFAGAPGPRFGDGVCPTPQDDPVTYPFEAYAGDVTFTEPHVGDRTIDFNTEGFVHIGLLPELLEDARRDAVSDADLEPLFRSAEGYLRMWERAEQRGQALQ